MSEILFTVVELANQQGAREVVAFSAVAQELARLGTEFNLWDSIVTTITDLVIPVGIPLMAGLTAVKYICFNED